MRAELCLLLKIKYPLCMKDKESSEVITVFFEKRKKRNILLQGVDMTNTIQKGHYSNLTTSISLMKPSSDLWNKKSSIKMCQLSFDRICS